MRIAWLACALALVGCGKDAAPGGSAGSTNTNPGSNAAVTTPIDDYRGVLVTKDAVTLDHKPVAKPDELVADRKPLVDAARAIVGQGAVGVGFSPDASAQAVLAAMRALDEAGVRELEVAVVAQAAPPKRVCRTVQKPPPTGDEIVDLSVTLAENQRSTTLSRINETQTFAPPYDKFADAIKVHKDSAFFVDRDDIRIAATSSITGAELADALAAICERFPDVIPVDVPSPEQLAEANGPGSAIAGYGSSTGWGTIGTGRYGTSGSAGAIGKTMASVSVGQPTVTGNLDKAVIRRYLKRNISKLTYCYEKWLLQKRDVKAVADAPTPIIGGTITVAFVIAEDGTVADHSASGFDNDVASCEADVVANIEFPKPKSGRVKVSYPLTCAPPK